MRAALTENHTLENEWQSIREAAAHLQNKCARRYGRTRMLTTATPSLNCSSAYFREFPIATQSLAWPT
eukprot:4563479-Pyramimonas_sp.AAC.1